MINRIIRTLLVLALIPSLINAQGAQTVTKGKKTTVTKEKAPEPVIIDLEEMEKREPPRSLEGPIDPDKYILGPLDELLLIIRGVEIKNIPLRVLPEGIVVLPNIGPFQAAGFSLTEFKDRLRMDLKRYYKNVDIDLQLYLPRTFIVFVLGEVEEPGPVELFAPFRLSRALDEAGGVTVRGSRREIEIREENRLVRKADLFFFLNEGDFNENPMLREGQSVLVPPRGSTVSVVGEVLKPGIFEVLDGETVQDLIKYSGGLTTLADKNRLIIERIYGRDSVATITFSLDEASGILLQDMDVFVAPDILSFPQSRFVYVDGGGGRNGRFFLQEGETLRGFLPRIWRFSNVHTVDNAVLERRMDGGEVEHIRFDPKAVFEGDPAGDMELKPGDVINVPPLEENVYIAGEVTEPGAYSFRADFRAEEYISLAGGPTKSGSYDRLIVYSANGSKRKASRETVVLRGETILIKKSRSAMLGSFIIGLGSLSGVLLAIVALTR